MVPFHYLGSVPKRFIVHAREFRFPLLRRLSCLCCSRNWRCTTLFGPPSDFVQTQRFSLGLQEFFLWRGGGEPLLFGIIGPPRSEAEEGAGVGLLMAKHAENGMQQFAHNRGQGLAFALA